MVMYKPKYWINAFTLFRTAEGLGIENFLLVEPRGPIPKKIEKKIHHERKLWNKIKIINEQTLLELISKGNAVSMELHPDSQKLDEYKWKENPTIIVGAEEYGIPEHILELTDKIMVPMKGHIKCFNVACAGSIALWDYLKQPVSDER